MKKLSIILIISLFAITACSTTSEPAEPAAALALEQNFSAPLTAANLSVDYPAGWGIGGEFVDFGITIATSEELATSPFDGVVEDGEVYLEILYSGEAESPTAVLQQIVDSIDNPEGTISEIDARALNGKDAALVTLDAEDAPDGMFIVIDSGDAYSTIVAAFADGALAANQATIEAIAGSIDYVLTTATEVEPTAAASD